MMNQTIQSALTLMHRDLDKLTEEINSYNNEADLWKLSGDIKNTAGNLCLHICGNLQHFIGAIIGKDGYVRRRDDEFGLKNVPKAKLLNEIQAAKNAVKNALENMAVEQLDEIYPKEVLGQPMTHTYFLFHLLGHLEYHLGQINYHRRIISM